MKKDKKITNIIGIIFLIFGISAIINAFFILKNPSIIIWFCHIGLILLGIGFLKRNKTLIDSQINILAIPLLIWTIDFLLFLFRGQSIFGISAYFFQQGDLISKIITSQHIFTIPLAIFAKRHIKQKKSNKSILLSLIIISIVFIISRFFGIEKNINEVYTFMNINTPYYPILWFSIVFLAIFLTNKLLEVNNS